MARSRIHRRRFLQQSSAFAASSLLAAPIAAADRKSANERLNLAIIGVGGRGAENLNGVRSENIVALCDVDENRAAAARKAFPNAKFYADYRRLFDQKGIDGVVISTPDHHHALPALLAMRAGLHVYCEKPLAHNVVEVRRMRDAADRSKVVTQMGTQIHAGDNYRRVVEIVRSGVLGKINRVKVWCATRPAAGRNGMEGAKVPAGLDYDLWLGAAPYRPYDPSHLHFTWRWWWDFGGGVLADMACHYMDLPYWALKLQPPKRIVATGKKTYAGDNNVPDLMRVDYHHEAHGEQPALHLTWYHGVQGPDLDGKVKFPGYPSGVLFEGEKGQLLADYGKHKWLPGEAFKVFTAPAKPIPPSIGHHREWIEAIKGNGQTLCPFSYSGMLAESVLLGNVAYRCGEELIWDAAKARVTNTPKAQRYLGREYRKGWELI